MISRIKIPLSNSLVILMVAAGFSPPVVFSAQPRDLAVGLKKPRFLPSAAGPCRNRSLRLHGGRTGGGGKQRRGRDHDPAGRRDLRAGRGRYLRIATFLNVTLRSAIRGDRRRPDPAGGLLPPHPRHECSRQPYLNALIYWVTGAGGDLHLKSNAAREGRSAFFYPTLHLITALQCKISLVRGGNFGR